MTQEQLLAAINALPKNPVEWDSAILAEKIKPILVEVVNKIPTVPTSAQTLADFTAVSTLSSFSSGSSLTKAQAATALGMTEAVLDNLFAGKYLRVVYEGGVLAITSSTDAAVVFGNVTVSVSDNTYAIVVA